MKHSILLCILLLFNTCSPFPEKSKDFGEAFIVKLTENNTVEIIWNKEKYTEYYKEINSGFILKTKDDPKNEYEIITKISNLNYFKYEDTNVNSRFTYYYRIILAVEVEDRDSKNNPIYRTENRISTPKGVKIP